MKKKAWLLGMLGLMALTACENEVEKLPVPEVVETPNRDMIANYKEPLFNYAERAEAEPDKFRLILQDDEPTTVVCNPAERSFATDELVQVRSIGDECRVTSYVLYPLKDVVIKARIPGYDEFFEFLKIDSLPALGQFDFTPEFVEKKSVYKTEKGNYVTFQLPRVPDQIAYKVESTDTLWTEMLSRVKVKWTFNFNEIGWGGNWADMNVLYAREWLLMMTNYAYMVSTPEWEYLVDHWAEVTGADLYANVANKVVIDYSSFFRNARANRSATLGLTTIGGGLGGAGVVGVDHWNFYSHYRSQGYLAIAHEAGHWWGYGHESSICSNYGHSDYSSVMMYLHDFMWRRNAIPYPDRELNKFVSYQGTPLFEGRGVADYLYNHKVGENYITEFFLNNPVSEIK